MEGQLIMPEQKHPGQVAPVLDGARTVRVAHQLNWTFIHQACTFWLRKEDGNGRRGLQ